VPTTLGVRINYMSRHSQLLLLVLCNPAYIQLHVKRNTEEHGTVCNVTGPTGIGW
jgi:hypothetical protein